MGILSDPTPDMDEAYLSWRYVPRLLGYARYGGFSMRPACASSGSHTDTFQVRFMSAPVFML